MVTRRQYELVAHVRDAVDVGAGDGELGDAHGLQQGHVSIGRGLGEAEGGGQGVFGEHRQQAHHSADNGGRQQKQVS